MKAISRGVALPNRPEMRLLRHANSQFGRGREGPTDDNDRTFAFHRNPYLFS